MRNHFNTQFNPQANSKSSWTSHVDQTDICMFKLCKGIYENRHTCKGMHACGSILTAHTRIP